jgi:hypothetical protein
VQAGSAGSPAANRCAAASFSHGRPRSRIEYGNIEPGAGMQATMDEVRGGAELFLCALGYPDIFHPRWFAQEHFEDGSHGIFFHN